MGRRGRSGGHVAPGGQRGGRVRRAAGRALPGRGRDWWCSTATGAAPRVRSTSSPATATAWWCARSRPAGPRVRRPGRGGDLAQGGAAAAARGVLAGRAPRRVSDAADVRVDVVGCAAAAVGPGAAASTSWGSARELGSHPVGGPGRARRRRSSTSRRDLVQGLPQFMLGGLPDAACAQSPDRVKAAAANIGVPLPRPALTVNLSPASIPKNGSGFDLPIAVAVLAASDLVPARGWPTPWSTSASSGSTARCGRVRGVLPAVLAAARAGVHRRGRAGRQRRRGRAGAGDPGPRRAPPRRPRRRLPPAVASASTAGVPESATRPAAPPAPTPRPRRRRGAARGAAGARAGRRRWAPPASCSGPPGRRARRCWPSGCPGAAAGLTREQSLEVTAVQSLLGVTAAELASSAGVPPPFVAPHHSASMAAIIGGGSGAVRPGAISQAHHGVLFLDEAPEFKQPAPCRRCGSRSSPARWSSPGRGPRCASRPGSSSCWPPTRARAAAGSARGSTAPARPMASRDYVGRLSGPLLDRVDLQVHVPAGQPGGAGRRARGVQRSASPPGSPRRARCRPSGWRGHPVAAQRHVPGAVLRRGVFRLAAGGDRRPRPGARPRRS